MNAAERAKYGPAGRPSGAWGAAIEHLTEAHRLMALMKIEAPTGEFTIADVHRSGLEAAMASIGGHWERSWLEVATARPTFIVDNPDS